MFGRSRLGPPSSLNGYVLIVAVAGLAVLAAAAAQGWATFAHPSLALWVLVAMALVTEVTPLSDHPLLPYVQSSSTSTPFVIAVLAQWGGAPAVIVGAASSLLGDVVHRRPGRKTIFNLAQYSLMYGTMAGVYHALGASPPFELRWRQVLTLVLAGAAGELVNLVATQLVRVLDTSPHPRGSLLRFLGVEARSWTGELGIALVVLVISQRSPLLGVVLEQAEQLDRLIGQLLLAARLQQPQFVTDPATTELADAATLVRRAGQLAT